jgi:DNA relaxase NicK
VTAQLRPATALAWLWTEDGNIVAVQDDLHEALNDYLQSDWDLILSQVNDWMFCAGRRPYGNGYRTEKGIAIYYNTGLPHVLVEISGKGCDYLRKVGVMETIIVRMQERMSRIDFAVDIETETTIQDYVDGVVTEKFKARSFVTSKTGDTQYIGSRASERYARFYRYNPPHPRHKYLRNEFVFRKKSAKLFAQQLIDRDFEYEGIAKSCGALYDIEHPDWFSPSETIPLSNYTPERRQGKTISWLCGQVAPAFKRMVKEGIIENPEEFLKEYFLNEQ